MGAGIGGSIIHIATNSQIARSLIVVTGKDTLGDLEATAKLERGVNVGERAKESDERNGAGKRFHSEQ